eukprot:TRINITY_DN6359_c0_g1_i1.p1 TRINITY_DN6359_c0_g1~~TRINITY_DN6359_c0_g1_i1.p1  ORF type:complete len:401 (+),score=65.11 TRINITY_DN6359_c0_g1_i1:68-1270(+)
MMSPKKARNYDVLIAEAQQRKRAHKKVRLLTHPLVTLRVFPYVLRSAFKSIFNYLHLHRLAVFITLAFLALATVLYFLPGAHQYHVDIIEEFALFCIWWVGLGVLSSVGLGTGLHTFVLYLGPHIAKVTLTATECNSTNFPTTGPESFVCPPILQGALLHHVTYWDILRKVQLAAFLWGAGTALGELPPYFVARAARLAYGEEEDESSDSEDDTPPGVKKSKKAKKTGFIARAKEALPAIVSRLGFPGILLFASIPNPLFDLAGIMCGHLLVPFATFFIATLIGKAVIKAHIQTMFVIMVFHKEHLAALVSMIERYIPFLEGKIQPVLDKERARLHRSSLGEQAATSSSKSPLALIWDIVLVSMILYFVISIINSSVQQHLVAEEEALIARLQEEKKKGK